MASKVAAKAAGDVMSITKKQTLQSTGIWERFRRAFAIDPNRSNGVPLNPYYRWPTPGALDPLSYDDPVTAPAGDIADNPYWKRDARRNYPRLSVVQQADAVALLKLGNARDGARVELIGAEGSKAVVAAEQEGVAKGLAKFLGEEGTKEAVAKDLFVNGMPPLPSGQCLAAGQWEVRRYELSEEPSYSEKYPCRSFE